MKLLKDMGLIVAERSGRSMALKTTDYFADYFGLTHDISMMKKDLKHIFGDALKDLRTNLNGYVYMEINGFTDYSN